MGRGVRKNQTPENASDPVTGTSNSGTAQRDTTQDAARATQIKTRVLADFNRVVDALQSAADLTTGERRADALTVIAILKEIRETLVAAGAERREDGAYLIVDWQDATEQVRRIVANDRASKKKNTSR
jgi:hypothetical protein